MINKNTSFILNALQHVSQAVRTKEDEAFKASFECETITVRGTSNDGTSGLPLTTSASSLSKTNAKTLVDQLKNLDADTHLHILELQTWLHTHPNLVLLLDEEMNQEFVRKQKESNRTNILINTLFTIIGAILGFFLPLVMMAIAHVLGF